jgi:hypothetical protein
MAIEDYFQDIIVLEQIGTETNQIGGIPDNWGEVTTLRGVINCKNVEPSILAGKPGENSEYNGLFECCDNAKNYLKPENRFKDQEGYIYKMSGKLKNTINQNHHFKVELIFVEYIEE